MKRRIRLTEGDLHRIVLESVGRILTEASKEEKESIKKSKLATKKAAEKAAKAAKSAAATCVTPKPKKADNLKQQKERNAKKLSNKDRREIAKKNRNKPSAIQGINDLMKGFKNVGNLYHQD